MALLVVYQLFFRYEYMHVGGGIARIDRLTGSFCAVPCVSTPEPQVSVAPSSTPTPTIEEVDKIIATEQYKQRLADAQAEQLQEAIAIAKRAPDVPSHDASYEWQDDTQGGAKHMTVESLALAMGDFRSLTGDPQRDASTLFIICLCDAQGAGWRWEVNTRLDRARFINDNAVLKKKYGL